MRLLYPQQYMYQFFIKVRAAYVKFSRLLVSFFLSGSYYKVNFVDACHWSINCIACKLGPHTYTFCCQFIWPTDDIIITVWQWPWCMLSTLCGLLTVTKSPQLCLSQIYILEDYHCYRDHGVYQGCNRTGHPNNKLLSGQYFEAIRILSNTYSLIHCFQILITTYLKVTKFSNFSIFGFFAKFSTRLACKMQLYQLIK